MAEVGLGWGLQAGVAIPVLLFQKSGESEVLEVPTLPSRSTGDLRLNAHWRLHGHGKNRWMPAMAVATTLSVPTGNGAAEQDSGGSAFRPELVLEWRPASWLSLATNLGYKMQKPLVFYDLEIGSQLTWSVAAGFDVRPDRLMVSLEAFGRAPVAPPNPVSPAAFPVEIGLGARWRATDALALTVGAGTGIGPGYGTPIVRGYVGFSFAPGDRALDRDGDGRKNRIDQCPDAPEDLDAFRDEDGCPDPDNDGDGLTDDVDRCPNAAEDLDGVKDQDGCPDVVRRFASTKQDENPGEPAPVALTRVKLKRGALYVNGRVLFVEGSPEALLEGREVLQELVALLKATPEITLLRIGGHSDGNGSERVNLAISRQRAEAVKRYLVSQGIVEERLLAVGFGSSRPRASNHTLVGRRWNRRVEFTIEQMQEGGRARSVLTSR